MMLYASTMLKVVIKNNLYLIQKYIIILVNRFNKKPIRDKQINKKTYVLIELSIVFDKNSTEPTSGNKIKLNTENNSLTKI
ncbi:hypothetical protein FACS189426_08260 [Bacteroidia bacterium]|nr:hypothetical protein FACS189426_08260 [Bacteroidia bacterium]